MNGFELARRLIAAGFCFHKGLDDLWRCYDAATFEVVEGSVHKEKGKSVRLAAEALGETNE